MRRFRGRVRPRWVLGFIALGVLAVIVFGGLVMMLWNALLPQLFHLPLITFWQALGLLLLAKILFGGFRGGPGRRWKRGMNVEWEKISPEERERIRQEWGRRCGSHFGGDTDRFGHSHAQSSATESKTKEEN